MRLWLSAGQNDSHIEALHHGGGPWAIIVVLFVFGGIFVILRSRTLQLRVLAILYVMTLCGISLTMRQLTTPPINYKYPCWVSVFHYFCTWVVAGIYWCVMREPAKLLPSSTGSMRSYCVKMTPIAISLPLSIAMNNTAFVYIGAGLSCIIATLTPVVTAVLSRIFGRRLALVSWLGVGLAFGGAVFAGWMEVEAVLRNESTQSAHQTIKGVCFTLLALILRSIRVVVQDTLLSPAAYRGGKAGADREPEVPLGGMHLLATQSPPVVVVAVVFALITEGGPPAFQHITGNVWPMLVVTTIIAVLVNVWGVTILKDLGSTSMQIIGKLNGIVTTAISLAYFGERLPISVLIGSGIIIMGVALFEQGERLAAEAWKK